MQNIFGVAKYIEHVTSTTLNDAISQLQTTHPSGFLILCCDNGLDDRTSLDQTLQTIAQPVFGGVFPNIIHQDTAYETGMLIIPMHAQLEVKVFEGLSECHENKFSIHFAMQDFSTVLMLVDGLARGIGNALNQVFQKFGQSLQVFGGGAGSLSFNQMPCLFTPKGIIKDAMLLVAIKQDVELAIGHGWEVLEGPFLANQVDDNQILQLNFEPAYQVYKDVIERHDARELDTENFFEIASSYPFGLERLDEKLLVRDPITVHDQALVCVGRVPENTMLYILKGHADSLIEAAASAIQEKTVSKDIQATLLFDCISRKLFLGDKFTQELHKIRHTLGENTPLFGALALGEIASGKAGGIDLHNKTAVAAIVMSSD